MRGITKQAVKGALAVGTAALLLTGCEGVGNAGADYEGLRTEVTTLREDYDALRGEFDTFREETEANLEAGAVADESGGAEGEGVVGEGAETGGGEAAGGEAGEGEDNVVGQGEVTGGDAGENEEGQ